MDRTSLDSGLVAGTRERRTGAEADGEIAPARTRPVRFGQDRRAHALGVLGAAAFVGLYVGIVSLIGSWRHAIALLSDEAPWVALLAVGFGLQVSLYVHLRSRWGRAGASGAVTGVSGGTSGAAMLACCVHHIADLVPLLGLSGAAVFFSLYRTPFLILGLLSNAATTSMLGLRLRHLLLLEANTSK